MLLIRLAFVHAPTVSALVLDLLNFSSSAHSILFFLLFRHLRMKAWVPVGKVGGVNQEACDNLIK